MRPLSIVQGSVILLILLLNGLAWADAFTNFFYHQKVGQKITITGKFSRYSYQRQFFENDYKTGDVAYFTYYGTKISPTLILGDGSLEWPPDRLERVLFLYPDEALVKDLPEEGENVWFTGTLIGYQYGISGITSDVGAGGIPYILLKQVSTQPPDKTRSQTPTP